MDPAFAQAALLRLLRKYTILADLRKARAAGAPIPPKAVFKALAEEFPGALYELDRLPEAEIEERKAALFEATQKGEVALWMTAMAEYHALYRAALYIKARTKKGASPGAHECGALAQASGRHACTHVSPAFVSAVHAPASGRIAPLVLAEVAARCGQNEAHLRTLLFPTRAQRTGAPPPKQGCTPNLAPDE